MKAGPEGSRHPLQMPRRPDNAVVGHGVATGIVQPVRPFIDLRRPGLHRVSPFAIFLDAGNASGAENAHHLVHGDPEKIVGNDQVGKIIGIRQICASQRLK